MLHQRLATLRTQQVTRDRAIAHNWRIGKYKPSIVAMVSQDYVRKLCLQYDLLAMGTASGAVVLADMRSGKCLTCRNAHVGQITAVHFRDGVVATAGSADYQVNVWKCGRFERAAFWSGDGVEEMGGALPAPDLRIVGHEDVVTAVRIDVNRRRIYSASVDGTVQVSDLASGERVMLIRVGEPVLSMVVTGKGYLLVGCMSGRVLAYQAEQGLYLLSMLCHKANTTAIDFWEETQTLVTGDSAGNLSLWSFKDSSFIGSLPKHDAAVMCVQLDSWKVVSASRDGSVAVSVLDSLRRQYSIHGFTKYLAAVTFDEARLIADGTNDIVICNNFDIDEVDSS